VGTSPPGFAEYAQRWLESHVALHLKPSTQESYRSLLDSRLIPKFGRIPLSEVTRNKVKAYLAEMVGSGKVRKNTIRNVIACLRAVMQHAVEDGIIGSNPAAGLGRFNKPQLESRRAEFLTREEAQRFLNTAKEFCPDKYPLFLAALRSGLREGELLALKWEDIQLGEKVDDPNRYILVRRNYSHGQFTTPKSHKARKVDLNQELRSELLSWRDKLILRAFEQGQEEIPKFVFPSEAGGPLDGTNLYHRYFRPCLEAAGLRPITFHALGHSFASQLIQNGASLLYVKEQLGHSSIQVTADIYGHLLPSANISWVDSLITKTSPQQSATPAQLPRSRQVVDLAQVVEKNGAGEGNRTPDLRFTKTRAGVEWFGKLSTLLYSSTSYKLLDSGKCTGFDPI
jgi:integrase